MKIHATALLLAGTLLSSTALAADLPEAVIAPEPVIAAPVEYNWSGAYLGLNGGWAFSGGWTGDDVGIFANDNGGRGRGFLGDVGDLEVNGGFLGAQAGFNWQLNRFVMGIEGDIQWSAIDDNVGFNDGGGATARADVDVNWFGTVRGRAGFAINRVMLYGTGGFAFADTDYRVVLTDNTGSETIRNDETDWGYVVGGGAEFAVTDNFTIKGEYQYLNFGRDRISSANFHTHQTTDFHTVRLGANFKFSGLAGM